MPIRDSKQGQVSWTAALRTAIACLVACATWAAAAGAAGAAAPADPDTPEPGSVEAIARFTTEPRFLSPWVAYVPASATVPSPLKFLGYHVGAPGELSHVKQIHGYARALAGASPRVRVQTIGATEEERDILLIVVADEDGLRDLDRLKAATAALADPRRTTPEQAETLIASARPFYYFNCGLHADETGSGEMCMELAYRLAVSEQPMIRDIRKNLVVLINPIAEPDGRDKVADWFHLYLKGKTDFDTLPRMSPPYWNKYVYVDINRDAHQQAFGVTRAVHAMFHEFHPQVIHDLHESIALLQTWNGTGPYNPHLDPIVTSQFLEMSLHEVTTLTAMGMPGVWTWDFGESFGLHFLDSIAMNHNAVGRGYETFGNGSSETFHRSLGEGGGEQDGYMTREWFRPVPPPQSFSWSMRDNTNYMETGCLSILDWSARHAKEMLRNFPTTSRNSWRKGIDEAPYAFIVPEDQPDRLRVAGMINRLRDQRIEVGRLKADVTLAEGKFARGAYIVKLDQPYRNYAVDLLTPQAFPADSPNLPYDDVSWALPVGFGVKAVAIGDARVKSVSPDPLTADAAPRGSVTGDGPVYLLADVGQEALLAARARLAAFDVAIAEKPFQSGGADYPAGSWIVPRKEGVRRALEEAAGELALEFRGAAAPEVARHAAPMPRLGLFVPWADTDMMGWVRLILDRAKVPYTYLRDEDIRGGSLKDKVDVIVYGPFSRLELSGQIHGIAPTAGPMPFRKTAESPSLGSPVASDDITGGPGYAGLEALRQFVESGGVFLTLGGGSSLALDAGLVRGMRRAPDGTAFTPGTELRIHNEKPGSPLWYGYGAEASVFRINQHVYDLPLRWDTMAYCTSCLVGPVDRGPVVATWGGGPGSMVVSGGMRGEKALEGRPAIFDFPLGRGHVVAYNFSPIHRDMNRSDHRFLWNAILNWSALPGPAPSH
ncbi:MAG TPA: M14 family zinc carboxypeptidase [Candidatus Polarisedimenticolia bacterium]|nr:M14 family zinc carboxypeptidase [Candidatus Polarisedimenticolia bacterium]